MKIIILKMNDIKEEIKILRLRIIASYFEECDEREK